MIFIKKEETVSQSIYSRIDKKKKFFLTIKRIFNNM
jgi:hypothetical protein